MKSYLVAISFFVLVSCNLREVNYTDDEINLIKRNIMNNRDTISYSDYKMYLYNSGLDTVSKCEILTYSLKMKEVYPRAYYDFYNAFLCISRNNRIYDNRDILKLKKPEQDLLIYYLQEGAKKENFNCLDALASFYEEGVYYEKNLKKADSLRNIYSSDGTGIR